MKKIFLAFALAISFLEVTAQDNNNFESFTTPKTLEVSKKIQINGYGITSIEETKSFMHSLYLTKYSNKANLILESQNDMAIRIEVLSTQANKANLNSFLDSGFEKSCGEKITQMQAKINSLKELLTDELAKGDVYVFFYDSKKSTINVYKNNNLKGKIQGEDFKQAFFGIWLSNDSNDKQLKDELLGIQ